MKNFRFGLILVSLAVLAAFLQGAIPATERQALIALYNATGGDSWTNNSGWKTPPLDTDGFAMPGTENGWFGITTGALNTTVTAINLATNNLIGSLPAAIGNLMGLVTLSLHHNNLSGPIPGQLGNLSNLQHIYMGWDQLTGSIPTELGGLTQLINLFLQENQLNGQIPAQLGNLANLHVLHLETNQLSGSIPAALGSLANLEYLALNSNQLSGSIPIELGNLTHVEFVALFSNDLTGSIPVELGKMTELRAIYLGLNDLTGPIPAEFGNLANLQLLFLHFNQLTGPIPAELGSLANLQSLSLDANQLTGPIPVELGELANLQYLYLNTNQLSGSIPAELGNLSQLADLFLHENQLSGSIPSELGNLQNLISLYLDGNQLSGLIPSELGNLANLVNLSLDGNQLSGPIPPELGALSRLQTLYLNFNQLSGSIPAQLGSLTNLQDLFLQANNLTGSIPVSLANLVNLDSTTTDIGYNALYTPNSALIAFLNSRDPDWASTQTVAPSDVTATALDGASILVSWTPIPYIGDAGYYELLDSQAAGGPYTNIGQTQNKNSASLQVNGLTPGQRYYFVVRTHTDAHPANTNAVESEYSTEVSAVAWTQVNVRVTGTVLAGSSPLANVLMSGMPGNPVTNSSGVYDVTMGAGWSGTVTPSLAGYTFVPSSRTYTGITVDQLGQDYAATFIPPTITVSAPNGGESWMAGSTHNITWTQTGLTGNVTIDLYKGGVFQKTLGTAAATAETFSWAIASGETVGTDYRILIWQGATSDQSNADFSIASAAIRKDDFLATWDGQGVYYKNSDTGAWVKMASPATMISCGDFDNDSVDDLAGLWPSQGGIWVKYSKTGAWARLSSTARYIATGDMNGDGRVDLLGTWDGQGVYYRNSVNGIWVKLASEATMIACGDLDGDSIDDLIGLWPSQGGIWVKYSHNNAWAQISSTARHISAGDMNGDGRDDLLGTWDGQGAFYRNSITGAWVKMASPATLITTGDLDGDGTDDLIGIWPTQGGVWVKYSQTGAWALLGSTARDISAGKMRPAGTSAPPQAVMELPLPMGGVESGPEGAVSPKDFSSRGPGGRRFFYVEGKDQLPGERSSMELTRTPGPGEPLFIFAEQENLFPVETNKVRDRESRPGRPLKKAEKH